jgi:outer membrane assembly lipoprotein YfiO
MRQTHVIRLGFLAGIILLFSSSAVQAFWIWTPETNRWVNPKYAIKDTPQEQLEYALGFFNAKDYPKATDEFKKLIKQYPRAREAAEAQFYIAECLFQQEQLVAAFKNYQIVIEKYPFRERSADIVKKQYEIANLMLDGKVKRNKFIKAVAGSDYDVIEIFRTVIKNAPYGEYAAVSQYKIGLYLQEKQMYQEARDEFEKTINDYPNSEWARAAKYQVALSDAKRSSEAGYDQKVTEAAITELKDFVKANPDAELSSQAHQEIQDLVNKEAKNAFIVAEFYEKQRKYDAAKIYYSGVVEKYPNTPWATKALNKIQALNPKIK